MSSQISFSLDPDSNTGSDALRNFPTSVISGIHFHVDGLVLLWDKCSFDVFPSLSSLLGVRFDFTKSMPRTIGILWEKSYKCPTGSLYLETTINTGVRCRLALSGKACSRANPELLLHFLRILNSQISNLRCSRIDLALDDFDKSLPYEMLLQAIKDKNYTGFKSKKYIGDFEVDGGWTIYLGSRESEQFTRIYNKSAESKGLIDSYRWETEFKDKKSQFIFNLLCQAATVESASRVIQEYIFGSIDFIDRNQKNLFRCKRLGWWECWLKLVGQAPKKISVPRPPTSVENKVAWMLRQVAKSLSIINIAFGSDEFSIFLEGLIQSGSDRLRRYDYLLIQEYMDFLLSTDNLALVT
jgi:DNA relaxase NicK